MVLNEDWIAGFFDGEGCISINRSKHPSNLIHKLYVQLTQKDKGILRRVQNIWGGSIHPINGGFHWRLVGPKASDFLKVIGPHLHCKDIEARLGIEFEELRALTCQKGGHPIHLEDVAQRDAYYWALREAK